MNPQRRGTKMACWYRFTAAPNETVELRLRLARKRCRQRRSISAPATIVRWLTAHAKPTHITRRCAVTRSPTTKRGDAPGVCRHGLEPAVLSLRRRALARRRSGRNRRRLRHAPPAATANWRHSTTTTSSRCRTSGNIRGTPRGTSRSTASCSRTPIPRRPNTSCCCCAASGTCTRTVSCRRMSGSSRTSIRRCTRGRRWRCSGSTAVTDFAFLASAFHKLLINFTWWVNRKDAFGDNIFEGGFLGLDNIGPFDRSAMLPDGSHARAVRRHGVDGQVLYQHARDGAAPRESRSRVRRRSTEVLRTFRRDRGRDA